MENRENRMEQESMTLTMDSLSKNEEFARVAVAVFASRLDPTLEELDDIKTAVSEAVTNAVIHGYQNGEGDDRDLRQGAGGRASHGDGKGYGHWHRGYKKGDGAHVYNRAGGGAVRDGLFLYGSLYGSGGGGFRAWEGDGRHDEKENRQVKVWRIRQSF